MGRSLVGVSIVLAMVGCGRRTRDAPEAGSTIASARAPVVSPVPPKAPAEPSLSDMGYADALTYTKSQMTDSVNDDSNGAAVFAIWGALHLRWTDVVVSKDETSWALTMKDSDEARGKRLCTSGQIVQIEVQKLGDAKLSIGLLSSNSGHLFRFLADGSTGDLVESSYARFCGVVTGKFDYANSGGGTGHAVSLVGIFDLPQNKPKAPTALK